MKLAFFGSPDFALPSLRALNQRFEVALVVSQPDKPAGRGLTARAPAVAREAVALGLPLAQPDRLKGNQEFLDHLSSLSLDVAVTVAYGKILPQALLDSPAGGFLNVHASLLPKYRGAAPIQWAIIRGEQETGVSIMRTEAGLDTGPVCLVRRTRVGSHERAPELFERLAVLGAEAIVGALAALQRDELDCRPQDDAQATMAPMLRREDGDIDWTEPADATYDRFRGVASWPGARFSFEDREVRVHEMRPAQGCGKAGEVLGVTENGLLVGVGGQALAESGASESAIELLELQPSGKGRMSARAWANGYRARVGAFLA